MFNTEKTKLDYETSAIFLGKEPGLVDTIHKHYPKIWSLYKEMKGLDWDEQEIDYSQCLSDFENVPKDVADMMIETLAYQWEADSIASRAPVYIIAPFNPATEVWEAELRINDNESIHANTYSEIVRMSFKNPSEVLNVILGHQASFKRMELISNRLKEIQKFSIKYAYLKSVGQLQSQHEEQAKECLIMFYYCMLCLERIQFMASFAITFTICKSGPFQPIAVAVKKIAQDELEVHCEYRKEVLSELRKQWPLTFENLKQQMTEIFEEVVDGELEWTKGQFENRSLIGTNEKIVSQWVLFNGKDVAKFMGLQTKYSFPKANPMPHLEDYLDIARTQSAPQEQDVAAYKVNIIVNDDANTDFELDFI